MRTLLPWLAALAGCLTHLDDETSAIGEVVGDCVVPAPAGVAALHAPVALEYPDRSLWLWSSLPASDGGTLVTPSAWASSAGDVCARGPRLVVDSGGAPVSLLALSADEVAANAARTDGKRLALAPLGGLVDAGTGYLFYRHELLGPGLLDVEDLGTGLCTLAAGADGCARVTAAGATVLWPPGARVLDRGGLVVGDRGLVFGCRAAAAFVDPCTVAGAPRDRLTDPAAWQVWSVFDGWQDAQVRGTTVSDEPGPFTVSAYDGGFLATRMDLFTARVEVRRSPRATDGYGHRVAAFAALPPTSWFVNGGREHAGLREDGEPRTIHVSYATDNPAAPGLHLVSFRFFGRWE